MDWSSTALRAPMRASIGSSAVDRVIVQRAVGSAPLLRTVVSGVFPPSCSERHSSEDANLLMASVRIYGRPYS